MKSGGLNERQERWVVEYATIGDGKQAAINAGYSEKVAAVVACRLLKKPEVIRMLNAIRRKDEKKLELTREHVLMELAKGLMRDPAGMADAQGFVVTSLRDIPPELRTIIDSFEVTQQLDEEGNPVSQRIKVKLVPKAAVIDMGMKHFGAYAAERQETRVALDWDSLYGRPGIVDPAEEAIRQLEREGGDAG